MKTSQEANRIDARPATEARHRVFLCTVFAAVTAMYGYLAYRLVMIQVVDHDFFRARAQRYHLFERSPIAPRGRILDCAGSVLAESVPVKSLWARPAAIARPQEVAARLAPILGISPESILEKLAGKHNAVLLADGIESNDIIARLEKAITALDREGDRGLDLHDAYRRRYPFGEELAHVLGAVGTDGAGLLGVERLYDSVLAGESGYERVERDGRTRSFSSSRERRMEPVPGGDVSLTIDMVCQHFLERQVQWAYETWRAISVVGVVLSPSDGRILALANRPTFHPEHLEDATAEDLKNRVVTDPLEPGSTFKPLIVAAALEEHALRLDSHFDCGNGTYNFERRTVHDVHPQGDLDVQGILVHSSNIGAAQIGRRLGGTRMRRYLEKYGFGRRTGVGLGGESPGRLTEPKNWSETYTTVSVSFGQEILATPLQLGLAFCALVNGGRYRAPQLIDHVVRQDGIYETLPLELPRQVLSPVVSQSMRELLVHVCELGSGQPARVQGYLVGGKTGTTEKFEGKVKRGYVSSFVGFAPAENPKLCVVFMVDGPRGQHYGRVVAAPAAGRVLSDCLAYLEIPPSFEVDSGEISRSAGASTGVDRIEASRDQGRSQSKERAW